jgi:hypothetical protein
VADSRFAMARACHRSGRTKTGTLDHAACSAAGWILVGPGRVIPGRIRQPRDFAERETGIEPATFSLATRRSTAELLPRNPFSSLAYKIARYLKNASIVLDLFRSRFSFRQIPSRSALLPPVRCDRNTERRRELVPSRKLRPAATANALPIPPGPPRVRSHFAADRNAIQFSNPASTREDHQYRLERVPGRIHVEERWETASSEKSRRITRQ